jgi:Holliday junction resolvase RusA-like endonuclease
MTLFLPWAVLVSDNRRHGVIKGRIVLTKEYREAKEAAEWLIAGQMKGQLAHIGPCRVTVALREPDRTRRRDLSNFSKLIHDALEKLAYSNDALIDHLEYIRDTADREPGAYITLVELTTGESASR